MRQHCRSGWCVPPQSARGAAGARDLGSLTAAAVAALSALSINRWPHAAYCRRIRGRRRRRGVCRVAGGEGPRRAQAGRATPWSWRAWWRWGWSPLWLLAAAADVTGGTRAYLDTFVKKLKSSGVLAADADVSSADDLLAALGGTSGQMADTIDIPPLALNEMRTSLSQFRQNAEALPDPRRLTQIFTEMNRAAAEQNRSLLVVSSLVAAGAIQAGIQLGNVHLFSFYRDSLGTIRTEGVPAYLQRISQPYLEAAAHHLRPSSGTHTQRLFGRFFGLFRRKHAQEGTSSAAMEARTDEQESVDSAEGKTR